jgi:hypothetical protein
MKKQHPDQKYTLIGIDGGATKVCGWLVRYVEKENNFTLTSTHTELSYSAVPGFISDFSPVPVALQLQQRDESKIILTEQEIQQGSVFIEACARVIIDLVQRAKSKSVLAGIGMPGLKTQDRRGINVMANGPRIPDYTTQVETKVKQAGLQLLAPVSHLGSDADYCGIGELYARDGLFRKTGNAYYLGGGTGAADALLLHKQLVPFDQTKNWLAKTWEMKNDLGLAMERYASTSGLQFIYSQMAGIAVEELNRKKIFPLQIARLALNGDPGAVLTCQQVVKYLSLLFLERIITLCSGWQALFGFVNPAHTQLTEDHPYRGEVFDRIVIGQRLGELLKSESARKVLLNPLIRNLSDLINNSPSLPKKIKAHYLSGGRLRSRSIVCSELRASPALGAGIDAFLNKPHA